MRLQVVALHGYRWANETRGERSRMPFAVAALSQSASAYCLLLIGVAGLAYASVARAAFVPGFTGIAATMLAALAYWPESPSVAGLVALVLGAALMNLEFLLPTFGCAGVSGIVAGVWGSWRLLEHPTLAQTPLPWRIALAVGGTGMLVAAIGRAWRLRTLPP